MGEETVTHRVYYRATETSEKYTTNHSAHLVDAVVEPPAVDIDTYYLDT